VAYLPDDKQFLITRGVPCHRRLDENYGGDAGLEDTMVREGGDEDEAWLQTGGSTAKEQARKMGEVRTLDASGNVGDKTDDEEEEIPDMEDEEDDDAIIRDTNTTGTKTYVPSSPTCTPIRQANIMLIAHYAPTPSTLHIRPITEHLVCISPATSQHPNLYHHKQ